MYRKGDFQRIPVLRNSKYNTTYLENILRVESNVVKEKYAQQLSLFDEDVHRDLFYDAKRFYIKDFKEKQDIHGEHGVNISFDTYKKVWGWYE